MRIRSLFTWLIPARSVLKEAPPVHSDASYVNPVVDNPSPDVEIIPSTSHQDFAVLDAKQKIYRGLEAEQKTIITNAKTLLTSRILQSPVLQNKESFASSLEESFQDFFQTDITNSWTGLSKQELEEKVSFLRILIHTLSPNSIIRDLNAEYEGFKQYSSSSFKKEAARFTSKINDPIHHNHKTRGKVAYFLELRNNAGDLGDALRFINNLITLSSSFEVAGVVRLLTIALKNEVKKIESLSLNHNANGYYCHAKSALTLANLRPESLKVTEVATENLSYGEVNVKVPREVGDIDIVAKENEKTLFIEVKSSVNAAISHLEQINALVLFASSQNAKPILLIGNLCHVIERVKRKNYFDTRQNGASLEKDIENINLLANLIGNYGGKLEVWDKDGKDVTNEVLELSKSLGIEHLVKKYSGNLFAGSAA